MPGKLENHSAFVPRSSYVHLPFCAHHCAYCDFAVTAGQDELMVQYVDALQLELQQLSTPQPLDTLFFGGGTPSYLPIPLWQQLHTSLQQWLPLQPHAEFSIEANPDDLTEEKLAALATIGVNRLSIGVQTFQTDLLPVLDRRHRADQAIEAIERAKSFFPSVSIDLIYAIPGQTLSTWQQDLQIAKQLQVQHISAYGLTFEKGTPLWKQLHHGHIQELDEEVQRDLFALTMQELTAAGYEHYEISNFALPGHRCKHNETYWNNSGYYGFGVGAARYVSGSRELNVRNTKDYIRRLFAGESPTFQREQLSPRETAFETLAVQLRRKEGVQFQAFLQQTGFDASTITDGKIPLLQQLNLLESDRDGFRLTKEGKFVADSVITEIMSAQ